MLSFIEVIPSRECVVRGEALNVLGGVANDGTAVAASISVWGRAAGDWEPLVTRRVQVPAGAHQHLYFTLEPACFAPDRWGGEIGEIELRIGDRKPKAADAGRLVFVE